MSILLSPKYLPILLLIASNVFMTFAWYAHLRDLRTAPWLVAVMGAVYFIFRG